MKFTLGDLTFAGCCASAGRCVEVCVCVCVGDAVADVESRRTSESFTCLTCTCTGLGWYPPTALPFSTKGARHPAGDNYCSHSLFVDGALKKGVCLWWMRVSLANVGRTSFFCCFFLPSSAFPIADAQTGCRQRFSSARRPSVWGWTEATPPPKNAENLSPWENVCLSHCELRKRTL